MFLTKKTWLLLAAAVVLGLLNAIPASTNAAGDTMPALAELSAGEITRIAIQKGAADKLVIEPDESGAWQVVGPYQAPADDALVRRLVRTFRAPIAMDARLDEGNLEDYRLDYESGVVVELFAGGEVPAVSFVVGADSSGGSSFLRLADDDAVYRASVGGRFRYDQPPSAWRDRVIVGVDPSEIVELEIATGDERFRFQRDGERWELVEDPDFPTDSRTVEAMAYTLANVRAGEVLSGGYDAGFEPPAGAAIVTLDDGSRIELRAGERYTESAAFVRREDRDAVYRVARGVRARMARGLDTYRELTLVRYDAAAVSTIRLDDGVLETVIAQSAPGEWAVREPANVDLDPAEMERAARALGDLRAVERAEASPAEAGMDRPTMRFDVTFDGSDPIALEIGGATADASGRTLYYARLAGSDAVYTVRDTTLAHIRRGFGRAQ